MAVGREDDVSARDPGGSERLTGDAGEMVERMTGGERGENSKSDPPTNASICSCACSTIPATPKCGELVAALDGRSHKYADGVCLTHTCGPRKI